MNGVIRFDQLNGERYHKYSVRKRDSKPKTKPRAMCLRNYQNREKDVYDTLHVKDMKEVSNNGFLEPKVSLVTSIYSIITLKPEYFRSFYF